ncbi:MAG TPA: hypothetical protein PKI60_02795 [Oscillospiraceae bacterium]|nr:hypothetical protein [Oscillospiraceae bacterium]
MNINTESLGILMKYAGLMLLILLLVFVIAVLTPKLSKIVEKFLPKKPVPERVGEETKPDVQGIYDPQTDENNEKNTDNGDADKNG